MRNARGMKVTVALASASLLTFASLAWAGECKEIHAELVEHRSTTDCVAPATVCFHGEVEGNHGLRGTTYFSSDSARVGPSTSPDWISYSGLFEYTLEQGTLSMRETGVTNPGAVTAYQEVLGGTGRFEGATGYLFVSGFKSEDHQTITTQIFGEICRP